MRAIIPSRRNRIPPSADLVDELLIRMARNSIARQSPLPTGSRCWNGAPKSSDSPRICPSAGGRLVPIDLDSPQRGAMRSRARAEVAHVRFVVTGSAEFSHD